MRLNLIADKLLKLLGDMHRTDFNEFLTLKIAEKYQNTYLVVVMAMDINWFKIVYW